MDPSKSVLFTLLRKMFHSMGFKIQVKSTSFKIQVESTRISSKKIFRVQFSNRNTDGITDLSLKSLIVQFIGCQYNENIIWTFHNLESISDLQYLLTRHSSKLIEVNMLKLSCSFSWTFCIDK